MRANCPFPRLRLAGGARTFALTTVWSSAGRKGLWQVRTTASGRGGIGDSAIPARRLRQGAPGAPDHVPIQTAAAGVLALAASTGTAAADCWQAAEHGDERAALAIVWIDETGDNVRKDHEKAEQYRQQALDGGYAHAFRLMTRRASEKYRKEAFGIHKEIKPASLKWNPEGKQGEREREEGRALVRAAAELGHPDAARRVGDWYAGGDGVDRDDRGAGQRYWRSSITNGGLSGPGAGERGLKNDECKDLVRRLYRSTGERPEEFMQWRL